MRLPKHTERLCLRPFVPGDAMVLSAYRSDPEVARYQSWHPPFPLEEAARFIEGMMASLPGLPGEWYQVAIERKDTGELIGDCAFCILADTRAQAEIGFTLARAHQQQGFGREAVSCLIQALFEEHHLHRIRAGCDAENNASVALLTRLGMRREAHFRKSYWDGRSYRDEYVYAITREEWASGAGERGEKTPGS